MGEMGRPAALCKLGQKRVRVVRCRGGNMKYRALRLDAGNFSWGSENCAKKVRVLDCVYNATSNELVRTKTLTKNTIVQVDAQPFKQWYLKKYGVDLGKKAAAKKGKKEETKEDEEKAEKKSRHVLAKLKYRESKQKLDPAVRSSSWAAAFSLVSPHALARAAAAMATSLRARSSSSTRGSSRRRRRLKHPTHGQGAYRLIRSR